MNNQELFVACNTIRLLAVNGSIAANRLNKVLGLCQRKDALSDCVTTLHSRDCLDAKWRDNVCKHRLALVLQGASV